MYCEFFGFKEQPFSITPNPRFIFLSKHHKEAFAHLLYGIESHAGFIELTGEVGSGKTTILRALLGQLDDSKHRTALVFNPRLSADELLRTINREFGITSTGTIDELMYALNQFLLRENAASRTVILVIDEAQNLDPVVLEQIRMISNLETDTDKLIQIVLAGQPELGRMLESENLRQLSQRIKVRFHLPPLDFDDMVSYIEHRLEIAGGWKAATFAPAALKKIFRESRGLPRLVNVLCDRALLIAYTEDLRDISPKMANIAIKELRREDRQARTRVMAIRRAVAAVIITALLLATGYLAGRYLKPAATGRAEVHSPPAAKPSAVKQVLMQSIKEDLGKSNEIGSAIQGFNELARLWNLKPVVEYQGEIVKRGLQVVSMRRGMRILNLRGATTGDIVRANAPSLLELKLPGISGTRYVALTRLDAGKFVLVSPGSGKVLSVDQEELAANWTGQAYILWRNSRNIPDSVKPGATSPEIRRLQLMLEKSGAYKDEPTGTFDTATRQAIRRFQGDQRIPVDGMPGPRTLLLLYRASGETTGPNLDSPGGKV